jgi:GNAT superfamily N-acetyltransferase
VYAQNVAESILKMKNNCDCQSKFEIKLARGEAYGAFKKVLNIGKHPTFIGRSTFERASNNGGALFYEFDGEIVAVTLINPHYGILLVMNVVPKHRGHGLGEAILNFLMPNFIRALDSKVEWFEKRGYKKIGKPKQGRRFQTQLMARQNLFNLAGRLNKVWG